MKYGHLLGTTALCVAANFFGMTSAFAQQATASADAGSIEEVTVTARKVSENIQSVPLQVTALSGESLEKAGVTDLSGILKQVPGVTLYGTGGSEASQTVVVRGQYDFNYAANTDGQPNVAVFLDGIYLQNPNALSLGLLDVDRVEVVEGPLSALYGRNAFNGAINYISKVPTDTFEANLVALAGEYGTEQVTADINGPIVSGILRGGIAYNYQNSDGPFKDSITGQRAGQVDKKDYKAELDFTPISALDVQVGYYVGNDHFGQDPIVMATPNCALAGGGNICGKFVADPIQIGKFSPASEDSGNSRNVQAGHAKVNYDLGFADITYLGGYNKVESQQYEDFSGLRNGLTFVLNPGPGTANVQELFGDADSTEDSSHELRVTSKQDQPFRWAFGGDYFQSKLLTETLIGLNGSEVPAGQSICSAPNFFFACVFQSSFGQPSPTNFTEATINEETYSGFASVEYDIFPNLTVGGEYRQTSDRQHMDIRYNSFIGIGDPEPYGPIKPAEFNYGNYRVYGRYKLTDDVMFYASVADGTKNGGFNTQSALVSNQSYGPEKNTTYEGGVKTNFLDDTLQLNADVFHIDTTGIQFFFPQGNGINTVIQNIGGTTNTGFELAAIEKPFAGLTLNGAFAYADPKFTSGTFDADDAFICSFVPSCAVRLTTVTTGSGPTSVINLKGLQEPGSSKVTVHLGLDYVRHLFDDVDGFLDVNYRYSSKQYTQITAADLSYTSGTNNVDLRAGINWENYSLALNIQNLTDDKTPEFANQDTELNNFGHEFLAHLPTPRIVSGELDVHF